MKEKNNIELRSDEVQEILTHAPVWMIRWGITLILSLIVLLLFISWFIKYPDVIQGQVTLTTELPPSRLVSQTNGYIEELLPNESVVSKGDVIAEIKSPIHKESIENLFDILNKKDGKELIDELEMLANVGALQNEINALINSVIEYQDLVTNGYFDNSLKNILDQIDFNKRLALITKQELSLLELEIINAKDKFLADSILYSRKVMAKHDFYDSQSEYFSKQQQLINVKKSHIQYKINSSNYEKQRVEYVKSFEDQKRQYETAIHSSKRAIGSSIANWKQSYILTAPIDGKLSYLSNFSNKQYVQTQQNLFAIIPEDELIIGVIKIADQAFGKVKLNQKVRMKFDNYPYQEFGQLVGTISEISRIPSEQGYFVKVVLEDGLKTTYNKEIQYKPEMKGVAEVVTDDLRLMERIFNNFRKMLDK